MALRSLSTSPSRHLRLSPSRKRSMRVRTRDSISTIFPFLQSSLRKRKAQHSSTTGSTRNAQFITPISIGSARARACTIRTASLLKAPQGSRPPRSSAHQHSDPRPLFSLRCSAQKAARYFEMSTASTAAMKTSSLVYKISALLSKRIPAKPGR